jgi:hypothetical protein
MSWLPQNIHRESPIAPSTTSAAMMLDVFTLVSRGLPLVASRR